MSKTCSVEGCNGKHRCKGYCMKHYQQYRKHGHVLERTTYDLNEIIEYEDYAEIVLYSKQNKEIARAIIDLECVEFVKEYKWHLINNGYVGCKKLNTLLHRYIMNPTDDLVVDHINHDRLDNRRDNLRICTRQENSFNVSVRCNNTSGATGVTWDKSVNKWFAQIYINGKTKFLGYYNTIEEAIAARRQAEIEYFGEYAPNIE